MARGSKFILNCQYKFSKYIVMQSNPKSGVSVK